MRTRSLALALLLLAAPASAFDPSRFVEGEDASAVLRYGYQAWKAGDAQEAADAFAFASDRGDVAAQWKLARMHEIGDGIALDHAKAYENYRAIVDRFGSRVAPSAQRAFVRAALAAMGRYSMEGVDGLREPSPLLAERYLYRAAALYGDVQSQYRLGVLYDDVRFGFDRPVMAARWLNLAAQSGHAEAGFRLGMMFAEGRGVPANRVRGLALMTRAAAQLHGREGEASDSTRILLDAYAGTESSARDAFSIWLDESGLELPVEISEALRPAG